MIADAELAGTLRAAGGARARELTWERSAQAVHARLLAPADRPRPYRAPRAPLDEPAGGPRRIYSPDKWRAPERIASSTTSCST